MPLKPNNLNGTASSTKNALNPRQNICLTSDNHLAKYFSKLLNALQFSDGASCFCIKGNKLFFINGIY